MSFDPLHDLSNEIKQMHLRSESYARKAKKLTNPVGVQANLSASMSLAISANRLAEIHDRLMDLRCSE